MSKMSAKKAAKLDMDDRAKILQYFSRPVGGAGDIAGTCKYNILEIDGSNKHSIFKIETSITPLLFQVQLKVLRSKKCLANAGVFLVQHLHFQPLSRFKPPLESENRQC